MRQNKKQGCFSMERIRIVLGALLVLSIVSCDWRRQNSGSSDNRGYVSAVDSVVVADTIRSLHSQKAVSDAQRVAAEVYAFVEELGGGVMPESGATVRCSNHVCGTTDKALVFVQSVLLGHPDDKAFVYDPVTDSYTYRSDLLELVFLCGGGDDDVVARMKVWFVKTDMMYTVLFESC